MKKSTDVKFSISIRKDTRTLIDELAFADNRSRSSMIELLILMSVEVYKKEKQQEQFLRTRRMERQVEESLYRHFNKD